MGFNIIQPVLLTQVRDSKLRRHPGHSPEELLSGPVFSEAQSEQEHHLHSGLAKQWCSGATAASPANLIKWNPLGPEYNEQGFRKVIGSRRNAFYGVVILSR